MLNVKRTTARLRKHWGWTTEIRPDLHFLELEAGGYSSVHAHRARANLFAVHSGIVLIRLWWGTHEETVTLGAGEVFEVPSLVLHQFEVVEAGTMTELYYADRGGTVRSDDIVRFGEGGKKPARSAPTAEPPRPYPLSPGPW